MGRRRGVCASPGSPAWHGCTGQCSSPSPPPPHTSLLGPFALKHQMCFILRFVVCFFFLWERCRSKGEQQLSVPRAGIWQVKCVISNPFILDDPDLKDIDPTVLKHCHAAAATCILEAGKQRADISAISTCLEDCKLDKERIEQFCTEYQKNKDALEILLGSIGRSPLHITDVSWRLEYQIKSNQLHKTYQPSYLVTLNIENSDSGSHPDVSFSCTMEQLQDLVGKLKDAAKSLERATQM
ncbi:COMM domain-containing protein 3 isoform X2 [Apus apus]|uniref:COMM domain-containing protein 3 isoform X2 n=1 Tax=Apus apus TaxID=8895 RepID=UPI0021F8C14D|nr:COMM domain-containing protein 3 isoform X2 [Apus apus]